MQRIFGAYAYGEGPRTGCWWDETCALPDTSVLAGATRADVAVIGGGFTGLNAALELARAGAQVIVLEARSFGWGASGRNGGFCCLGGGRAGNAELDATYGKEARVRFRQAEKAAVAHVAQLIGSLRLDVDRHSNGETELAHRPKDMAALRARAETVIEDYGVRPQIIEQGDLVSHGMGGGPFFGALTVPLGFGLNPRKFLAGLMRAATDAGARLCAQSEVRSIDSAHGKVRLETAAGTVVASRVLLATNGYASEDIPPELAGRYMPTQSTVLVTRPLAEDELAAQGWTTTQMSYDSRYLLHYFRLMPDKRFLFGMRGGLLAGARSEASARVRLRADFERMFPGWRHVESAHSWSGLVCLSRRKLPFVGPLTETPGVFASMCYHGNGVAMGSFCGSQVAKLLLGTGDDALPEILQKPLARFPLGRWRRLLMPPLYAGLLLADRF